mgnify:CR=1 FL=1|tara:strand:- start:340 stop:648 length:309 start_codon:yes stop_codon:yes gene_type:complete
MSDKIADVIFTGIGAVKTDTGYTDIGNSDKVNVTLKAAGGSVDGTLKIFGKDAEGDDIFLASEVFTEAGTTTFPLTAVGFVEVTVHVTAWVAGTFAATINAK